MSQFARPVDTSSRLLAVLPFFLRQRPNLRGSQSKIQGRRFGRVDTVKAFCNIILMICIDELFDRHRVEPASRYAMALAKFFNNFKKWVGYGDGCFHCANYNRSYTNGSYRRYSCSVVSDASPFSVTGGVPHNVECSNPYPTSKVWPMGWNSAISWRFELAADFFKLLNDVGTVKTLAELAAANRALLESFDVGIPRLRQPTSGHAASSSRTLSRWLQGIGRTS